MGMTRRSFLGSSASAVLVAGTMATGKIFGANDRVRVCCMGIRGRGGSHISAFTDMDGSEIVALCDVDKDVLESRSKALEDATGKKHKRYIDVREALADGEFDALSIATPNHWHTLPSIWAMQAGKDVYVEKPISHCVWEGRQLVEVAKKTGQVCMHGTQNRSDATWMRDMRLMHEGIIGKIHFAKGFTYKTGNRHSIGFTEPKDPPANLDWNLWQGPRPVRPYKDNYVHYNWHWFWPFGNGETGNQGVHEMDLAVWGLNKGWPVKVYSSGGRHVWDDEGETPNLQTSTFTYADDSMLVFEIRNVGSYPEGGQETAAHFLGSEGYYLEGKGFFNYSDEPIEVDEPMPETDGPYGNFIKAVRSRKPEDNPCGPLVSHVSASHCHLGNIAYRVGRSLEWDDDSERFTNDAEANALLKDEYREEFKVPTMV